MGSCSSKDTGAGASIVNSAATATTKKSAEQPQAPVAATKTDSREMVSCYYYTLRVVVVIFVGFMGGGRRIHGVRGGN